MRWANKTLIKSVTGNRGSNQTIIDGDNWPRQWPNQLRSALVCWSTGCAVIDGRQPSRQTCRGSVLPALTRRDAHWVWGILTFRRGEGLVMRGLGIIHPVFSDLVSFPKSPLCSNYHPTKQPFENQFGFFLHYQKGIFWAVKGMYSLGVVGKIQWDNICRGIDPGCTQ